MSIGEKCPLTVHIVVEGSKDVATPVHRWSVAMALRAIHEDMIVECFKFCCAPAKKEEMYQL